MENRAESIFIFKDFSSMERSKYEKVCGINLQILDCKYLSLGPVWWEIWYKRKKPRYRA